MKSFKISNLVTKILFSVKTRKLIHMGYKIRAGGSEIFSKKKEKKKKENKRRGGGDVYSGPKSTNTLWQVVQCLVFLMMNFS